MKEGVPLFEDDDRGDIDLGIERRVGFFMAWTMRSQGYVEVRTDVDKELRLHRKACWWCGKALTWRVHLRRLKWAPWWRRHSFMWRHCCSLACYRKTMATENRIAQVEAKTVSWRPEEEPKLLSKPRQR